MAMNSQRRKLQIARVGYLKIVCGTFRALPCIPQLKKAEKWENRNVKAKKSSQGDSNFQVGTIRRRFWRPVSSNTRLFVPTSPLLVLQLVKFPKKLRVLHHTANIHREVDYSKSNCPM